MKEFGLANEVYVSFITEKKCYLGVPSRSTIELPLVQAGLGKAYVEVLVSDELVKRILHVQSISCWAPSCIGPYSQVHVIFIDNANSQILMFEIMHFSYMTC
jgi:diphthine-ammonia ligase